MQNNRSRDQVLISTLPDVQWGWSDGKNCVLPSVWWEGYQRRQTICYSYTVHLHTQLALRYVFYQPSFTTYSHNPTLIQHSCFSLLMSIESAKILRNGKVLADPLPKSSSNDTNSNPNLNMESSTNFSEETNRSGRNSPTNEDHTQMANEERFNRLQDKMSVQRSLWWKKS